MLSTVFFLLSLLTAGEVFGELSRPVNLLLAVAAFVFGLLIERRGIRLPGHPLPLLLVPAAVILFFTHPYAVLSVPLLLYYFAWTAAPDPPVHRNRLWTNFLIASLWTPLVLLYLRNPYVSHFIDQAALGLSPSLSSLWGVPIQYSATAQHWPLWALIWIAGAVLTRHSTHRLPRLAVLTGGVILLSVLVTGIGSWIYTWRETWPPYITLRTELQNAAHVGQHHAYPFGLLAVVQFLVPTNMESFSFLLGIGLLALVCLPRDGEVPVEVPVEGRLWKPLSILGALLLLAGSVLLFFQPVPSVREGIKVLIFDRFLDFRVPDYTAFGPYSSGMFGRLPNFLEEHRFEVRKGIPSSENLAWADVLVIINLQEDMNQAVTRPGTVIESATREMDSLANEPIRNVNERIARFVKEGGGLLTLGDHTGVTGIRDPLNSLLKPFGIEYNLDSAKGLNNWMEEIQLYAHPLAAGEEKNNFNRANVWVGASLKVRPPAFTVLSGRYGYSDPAQLANTERAFLGDLMYTQGEQLGGVPLVAGASYGKGRVLAFGDTSPYQNEALINTWPFALRTFAWLAANSVLGEWPRTLLGIVLGIAGLVLLLPGPGGSWRRVALLVLPLAFSAAAVSSELITHVRRNDLPKPRGPVGMIDLSHAPYTSFAGWKWPTDTGSLGLTLLRSGYIAQKIYEWPEALPDGVFLSVNPQKPYSPGEIEDLLEFTRRGGTVIVSSGYEISDGVESLLEAVGASILAIPLGSGNDNSARIYLPSAWPVAWNRDILDEVIVHCSVLDHSVVAERPIGKGRFIVIGDPKFLHSMAQESQQTNNTQNILFLRSLLERTTPQEGGPES